MNVIRPSVMLPAMLVSTNATEAHGVYAPATTYALGARVVFAQSIFESLSASNTGNTPDVSPIRWLRIGPSNAFAMFDDQISTQTTRASPLTVTVATGIMDALAVVGVDADAVTLTVTDGPGGAVIYQQTRSVTGSQVYDWYEYFFNDPTMRQTQALFLGIPPFASSRATLSVSGAGTVRLGGMVFGRLNAIGLTNYGAQAGITDYSRKQTDEFGTTTFVRRAFSKKLTATVMVKTLDVNRVQRLLYDLRATPAIWIGTDVPEYSEPLVLYGFYRDFYCAIDNPSVCQFQLEIEGLI
jgi:hypothetical protein